MATSSRHSAANARLAGLEIIFEEEGYHAGDIIEGQIKIKVAKEILVRNVSVSFYGEIGYREPDETPRAKHLWQRSCDLWKGVPDCFLPPGLYSYRFSIGTPLSLPTVLDEHSDSILSFPSTSSQSSPIINYFKYFCEVRVHESHGSTTSDHVRRKEIRMEGVCLDWPDSRSDVNVAREIGYVRNILDASGTIGATLKLNRGWALPGSSIFCNVEVLNCFRKLHVELRMIERLIVISKGTPFTSRNEEEIIYVKQLGNVKSSDAYRRWLGVDCWIPDDTVVPYRERDREIDRLRGAEPMIKRISRGIFIQLRVKSGVLSNTLSIALPVCIVPDARFLPRRLHNGTNLSGAATV